VLDKGQHPKFSSDFVSAHRDIFAPVCDVDLLQELVQKHHQDRRYFPPEFLVESIQDDHRRTLATLVSKADNLSSSERGKHSEQWQDYKTTPLSSVLERLDRQTDEGLHLRLHAKPLSSTADLSMIFPEEFTGYGPDEMNHLLEKFGGNFTKLFHSAPGAVKGNDFDYLIAHLTNLIYTYTWCIPSDTQEIVPDISLFDHLKITAAIAACLYSYHTKTDTLNEKSVGDAKNPHFLLAAGDLSGIQSYIFDIASTIGVGGGVARRLRARSLYVQLCAEVASHIILKRFKLPLWNIIMNSGGRFYLLLPNLDDTKIILEEVQNYIDEWFIAELNGELALNLAYYSFGDEGFKAGSTREGGFSEVLSEISTRLNKRKQNRFAGVIRQGNIWQESKFAIPVSFEGKRACVSCHKFPEEVEGLCSYCRRDGEVGRKLLRAKYISFFADADAGEIPILGYSISLSERPPERANPYLVMKLNDTILDELTAYPATTKW
jgi:CRISPR-associated protein Csm1